MNNQLPALTKDTCPRPASSVSAELEERRTTEPGGRARRRARPRTVTWVKQHNGSQAPQLRLVHLHVFHFGDQLSQDPVHRKQGEAMRKP